MILQKKYQKLGMIFCKNAQALNKATQGGFFFSKTIKAHGLLFGREEYVSKYLFLGEKQNFNN